MPPKKEELEPDVEALAEEGKSETVTSKKKKPFDPLKKPEAGLQGIEARERELRRYIKRSGGFCKGLKPADKARAEQLMKELGRKEPKWDHDINLEGFNDPNAHD